MVGLLICYWSHASNGCVESRNTIQRVTDLELQNNHVNKKLLGCGEAIKDKFEDDFIFERPQIITIDNYLQ